MTAYLIRRLFQMVIVIFVVSIFMYLMFSIAPGGPFAGLAQQQRRITPEERARLRAQYELDLYWPFRYTRWLIGWPVGPITLGGNEVFANLPLGCYLEATPEEGGGCADYVYAGELPRTASAGQEQSRHSIWRFWPVNSCAAWPAGVEPVDEPFGSNPATATYIHRVGTTHWHSAGNLQRGEAVLSLRFHVYDGCLYRFFDADVLLWADVHPHLFGAAQHCPRTVSLVDSTAVGAATGRTPLSDNVLAAKDSARIPCSICSCI